MALPDLPGNVALLPSASHDLARILRRHRLGQGTLPPQGKKKLQTFDAFQIDAGRYRIVYSRRDAAYVIWAVFAKPDQQKYLRRFRVL